jgi:hypothetical protein
MGGRYLITGVQLGIIRNFTRTPDAINEIDRTIEHQFVFESDNSIYDDILKIRDKLSRGEDDGR